ncbi:DUF257 family protein [Palaeococcus sp. (in: euryarchaeotes)]
MSAGELEGIISKLKPGETVMIEYESNSSPEVLLFLLYRYSKKNNMRILVDDIADTFLEYLTRLEIMGFQREGLDSMDVIKAGGTKTVGNVVAKVELDRYMLDFKYYGKKYNEWRPKDEVLINPVLGIYKLFIMADPVESMRLVKNISTFVGNKSRIAFYFINYRAVEDKHPFVIPLMEEICTTVLKWNKRNCSFELKVIKASSAEIEGEYITLKLDEIQK